MKDIVLAEGLRSMPLSITKLLLETDGASLSCLCSWTDSFGKLVLLLLFTFLLSVLIQATRCQVMIMQAFSLLGHHKAS